MSTRYDPVVFDLDGTVLDSAPAVVKALKEACERTGVSAADDADLASCVGPPLERALPQVLGPTVDVERLIATYRDIYRPLAEAETPPMPGVVEVLEYLRGMGTATAIATYKPVDLATSLLGAAHMAHLFDRCEGRVPPGDRRTKAEILDDALARLAPHAGTPLYIGDHEEDRLAAEALSIDFISYGPGTSWRDIGRRAFEMSERDDDRSRHDAAAR